MIAFLRGFLIQMTNDYLILDVQGVGYQIYIHSRLKQLLDNQLNKEIKVLTHLIQKEEAQMLYGFSDSHEKEVFMQLIKVSGVGPKTALGIISSLPTEEIVKAIVNNQSHLLKAAPGIGLKTAQRIILELREKLSKLRPNLSSKTYGLEANVMDELEMTLLALGYSEKEIQMGFQKIEAQWENYNTTEEVLPHLLSVLSEQIP